MDTHASPSDPVVRILEADPILRTRLRPGSSWEMKVAGRTVLMDVDEFGCRPVNKQPLVGQRVFAAYGCSCTFGHAIAASETFPTLLQVMSPSWRIENYGVPGYGTTQNLLHLQRNARWRTADYVTFCWIPHHLSRNIADISWVRSLMPKSDPRRQSTLPRASIGTDGKVEIEVAKLPRWDLDGLDLTAFQPDAFYLELVCLKLFERASEIVRESGGHFFVTTLLGNMSEHLRSRLRDADIPLVNASLEGREFTNLPDDHHPNALANQIYAQKIYDYLESHHVA